MRILCVWFPHWPIQRLVVEQPQLKRQAIVLTEEQARRGLLVAACSPLARKHGVRLGMPLAEAASLLNHNDPYVELHRPGEDYLKLQQLASDCEQFSPLLGLEEVDKGTHLPRPYPESLLLNITHLQRLFGSEENLLQQIEARLKERGYLVRLAVADTVGAAWAAAHYSQHRSIVKREEGRGGASESLALESLPIEALRLPRTTVQLLRQLGILQVQQLRKLPRASLTTRFGPELILRLDQFDGRAAEIWEFHEEAPSWQVEKLLEFPTRRQERLEVTFRELLSQLVGQLRDQQQGALRVHCRLDGFHDVQCFQIGLFRPTADENHLWSLIAVQLERVRLKEPVQQVSLTVPVAARLQHRQTEMFGHLRRTSYSVELTHLIDRIGNRLGQESIVRPRLQADAQPERAFRYDNLTFRRLGRSGKPRSNGSRNNVARAETIVRPSAKRSATQAVRTAAAERSSSQQRLVAGERPLCFHNPAIPLREVLLCRNVPLQFHVGQQQYLARNCWGPERIETAWWRGKMIQRDYYRVETTQNNLLWVYFSRRENSWFLQGTFH